MKALQHNGVNSHFFLNHAISLTERGTLRVLPFLPSLDFSDLTLCLPALSTVFSATFLPAAVAFDAAALVFDAAFFAVDLVLVAAFFAVDFALETALDAVFFADAFFFAGAFFFAVAFLATAASSFFEMAALRPAFASPFCPALLMPAADLIPASLSFFAVAFPTPGNAIRAARGSFLGLAAMSSPNTCMTPPHDEPFSQLGGLFKVKC